MNVPQRGSYDYHSKLIKLWSSPWYLIHRMWFTMWNFLHLDTITLKHSTHVYYMYFKDQMQILQLTLSKHFIRNSRQCVWPLSAWVLLWHPQYVENFFFRSADLSAAHSWCQSPVAPHHKVVLLDSDLKTGDHWGSLKSVSCSWNLCVCLCVFVAVASTVKQALQDSLVHILQPKRRVDILRDVMEAQSQRRPFVITFCGVNGVGKSTNLAKVRCWVGRDMFPKSNHFPRSSGRVPVVCICLSTREVTSSFGTYSMCLALFYAIVVSYNSEIEFTLGLPVLKCLHWGPRLEWSEMLV